MTVEDLLKFKPGFQRDTIVIHMGLTEYQSNLRIEVFKLDSADGVYKTLLLLMTFMLMYIILVLS